MDAIGKSGPSIRADNGLGDFLEIGGRDRFHPIDYHLPAVAP